MFLPTSLLSLHSHPPSASPCQALICFPLDFARHERWAWLHGDSRQGWATWRPRISRDEGEGRAKRWVQSMCWADPELKGWVQGNCSFRSYCIPHPSSLDAWNSWIKLLQGGSFSTLRILLPPSAPRTEGHCCFANMDPVTGHPSLH